MGIVKRGTVIIIEGPDGAGKTRLAEEIQRTWAAWSAEPLAYLHQGPYTGDPLVETVTRLEQRQHRGHVICDRLHLGEQVYGPIYRGQDALGVAGRRMLERYLLSRRAVVFLALPPFDVAHENWATRRRAGEEMFPDEAGYRAVYDAFRSVRTQLPLFWYDYTSGRDVAANLLRARATPHCKVLLVGEQLAENALKSGTPFAGRGGCAEWLAEQLDDAGIPETHLRWWNAKVGGKNAPLPTCLDPTERDEHVNPPAVIALGKTAATWVADHVTRGVTISGYACVPHPQFWKRFHHRQPYPLLALLSDWLRPCPYPSRNGDPSR